MSQTETASDFETAALRAGWILDPRLNKWRHPDSTALYCNTPRWARYACEDHKIDVPSRESTD